MTNEAPSEKSKLARERAQKERAEILTRLDEEDETELADRLRTCGEKLRLTCSNCGQWKEVEKGCKQKWCPVCARSIAGKRVARYELAIGMMQWPLFVTLTIPPSREDPLGDLKRLRRAAAKLRRKKLWTTRVKGGVAGLEISSKSGKFHPHMHHIIDCQWLAITTPRPQKGESIKSITRKCREAKAELGRAWAKCVKISSSDPNWAGVVIDVQRAHGTQTCREILKYAAKGSDLVAYAHSIGPVIRALQCTRLVTSFGSCYGDRLAQDGAERPKRPCACCGEDAWVTDFLIDPILRSTRESHRHYAVATKP